MTADVEALLAFRLREAHLRVAALDVDGASRERAFRRLLAIADASKRDTRRAATRLDFFLSELDAGRVALPNDGD